MKKSALKNFAITARRELLKKVEARALKLGITENKIKKADVESADAIFIDGRQLDRNEKIQRDKLISRIREIGFERVIDEVAYTWFNRFIALRYMEVNDYLPTKVRVLSSLSAGSAEPDMIKEALSLDLDLDKEYVYELKTNNKTEELFKYLIIQHCNDLNRYMPFMFETINHYTEILFPEGLLGTDSFIRQMTDTDVLPEEDWQQVEIIGWLYQYYIAEEKDRVIKAKKKYKKEEIPFATQLFTPNWIVRYMVQNTLGRYWMESHPEHRNLVENWEFYLESPNQQPDFKEKMASYITKELKVEDIKCFDPAMGSGHILVYMFDILHEIYSKSGYMEREIPRLIIENNLYGLDIDDRAYQLACFSVVMKAVGYNKRFLRSIEREGLTLNLAAIQETNHLSEEDVSFLAYKLNKEKLNKIMQLIKQFKNAKQIGSLIKLSNFDHDSIKGILQEITDSLSSDLFEENARNKIIPVITQLIKQSSIIGNTYDIVITNPPYMGSRYMPAELNEYIGKEYKDYKGDLFSAFISFIFEATKKSGHIGLVTPYVWMFIKNYLPIRKEIIESKHISSLIELEYNSFEGATVPVCTFTMKNELSENEGSYIKLAKFKGVQLQPVKVKEAISNPFVSYRYQANSSKFKDVTGYRIAYWFNDKSLATFSNTKIADFIQVTGSQNITSDNKRFLRYFWEVEYEDITNNHWPFYNKGGEYRKWYGNTEWVVNWSEQAKEFYKNSSTGNLLDQKFWFKEGLTYNGISNRGFSVRKAGKNIYDKGGPTIHPKSHPEYLLGLLNSKYANEIMNLYNPTLNYQVHDVKDIPIIIPDKGIYNQISELSNKSLEISKQDWDFFETSWDFEKHPFVSFPSSKKIEKSFNEWSSFAESQFNQLKANEEELNRLFIEIYGLEDELTPEVEEKDVTIRKADLMRDVKSFISYAIGCSFGRYSLDEDGIIYAGGEFDPSRYKTYSADTDNILPILPGAYFGDDIVSRFVDFVHTVYGEESLAENLDFVADAIGRKSGETARETLRRYFLNDFFKDHTQTYKKRPIYWLFTSGKEKAFNCLVYMHRYDKTTLSRIRTDYLHEYQIRLDAEKKDLLNVIEGDSTTKEINAAKKQLKSLDKKIDELKAYDELLHHMADMQIEMDLDDGVKVNYEKFKGLVAPIK